MTCDWSSDVCSSDLDHERVVAFHGLRLQCAALPGGVPERPKGTGCKPVGSAYGGSNPPAPIFAEQRADCAGVVVDEIGRASCRERVESRVGADPFKQKTAYKYDM